MSEAKIRRVKAEHPKIPSLKSEDLGIVKHLEIFGDICWLLKVSDKETWANQERQAKLWQLWQLWFPGPFGVRVSIRAKVVWSFAKLGHRDMPLYKAQQITKDCCRKWWRWQKSWCGSFDLAKNFAGFCRFFRCSCQKREAFTSSSCTGLVRCLHQSNLRVQWLCCNTEIWIWMEELKRAQCVGTMQRLWKGSSNVFFVSMVLECSGDWSEVRWSRVKSEVSGREVGDLMRFVKKGVWSLTESGRSPLWSFRRLRRSGLDGYCVGLRHLCTEELRPGSATGRNAWPRHSATPHAVRSSAAGRQGRQRRQRAKDGQRNADKIEVGRKSGSLYMSW